MNTITLTSNRFRIVVFNLLLIITLGFAGTVHAQETTKKNRLYKTWVKKTDSKTRLIGTLYQVEDNKLRISKNQFDYQDVYAHEIKKIKLRRTGKIGRGVLIGALSGLFIGAAIGLLAGESPDPNKLCVGYCGGDALPAGIALGLMGGIVGAVVGSLQIKIPINGSQEQYRANLPRLKKYAYQKIEVDIEKLLDINSEQTNGF